MQQVADVWRELCEEDQLKFCNWDFINDLRIQMGLEPLDDPEALEPEDEAEEIDANQPHPRNPATINTPKETVALPMSKKSNYEAESACDKWVNKAVRDVSDLFLTHLWTWLTRDLPVQLFQFSSSGGGILFAMLNQSKRNCFQVGGECPWA
jgi:hypothetical protein